MSSRVPKYGILFNNGTTVILDGLKWYFLSFGQRLSGICRKTFQINNPNYACFGSDLPRKRILQKLDDFKVKVIQAGEELVSNTDNMISTENKTLVVWDF